MKRRKLAAVTAVVTAAAVAPAAGAYAAGTGSSKTALTSSGVAGLIGGSSRVAYATPLSADQSLSLALQLPQRNMGLANAMLAKGTVVSTSTYTKLFGASPSQLKAASAWAKSQGLKVTSVSAASGQVQVTGSTSKVNKAFGVKMRAATLGSTRGYAAQGTPSVPSSLGITGVSGLTSLHKMSPQHKVNAKTKRSSLNTAAVAPHANGATDGSTACAPYWGDHLYPKAKKYSVESNYLCGYTPQNLSTMYKTSAASKATPTLGILLWHDDPQVVTLTNQYMTAYKYAQLTKYTKTVAAANANDKQCDNSPGEQDLDVQSTHSIAPNGAIHYYGAASCYDVDLTKQLQLAVDQHKVSTISMSFGSPSDAGMTAATKAAWDRPLRQAALTGISAFASTGDGGDNSFTQGGKATVSYPSSNAYLTAVGGTTVGMRKDGSFATVTGWESRFFLQPNINVAKFTDETRAIATQQGDYSGGGGGLSSTWAQPTWQHGVVKSSSTRRAVPDISAIADPETGFRIRTTDAGKAVYESFGGTSLASPVVAALVGIAKATNKATIGNVAQKLYSLGTAISDVNAPSKSGIVVDFNETQALIAGDDAKPQSLVSGKGWDSATGLGTPNGAAFLTALK